jgi:hypothetical protein
MQNRLLRCTLALLGLTAICHPSTAQVVAARWQFADTNGNAITGTPSFAPGSTITWRVYLADAGGTSAPFLNKTTTGANGTITGIAGFGVTVSSSNASAVAVTSNPAPPGGPNPVSPNITGTPWVNVGASASNSNSSANAVNLQAFIFAPSPVATVQADATGRVFVGTYQFAVPTTASGSATLTAATRAGFTVYSGDNGALDPSLGSGTQALTISAVPEPGSMLLCGLGAVGLAAYRRRTRKATAVDEAAE